MPMTISTRLTLTRGAQLFSPLELPTLPPNFSVLRKKLRPRVLSLVASFAAVCSRAGGERIAPFHTAVLLATSPRGGAAARSSMRGASRWATEADEWPANSVNLCLLRIDPRRSIRPESALS